MHRYEVRFRSENSIGVSPFIGKDALERATVYAETLSNSWGITTKVVLIKEEVVHTFPKSSIISE